ncbi:UvrABC system protein A [Crateriforma conspicua]|uniref:UvrABC system protein A n=1 Tax=Crateriforma conspicua TaxID=2527996 RepID=A0A5C5YBL1_9PLAN|nr:UvrABC system protein A [Crateriforma conspicua]
MHAQATHCHKIRSSSSTCRPFASFPLLLPPTLPKSKSTASAKSTPRSSNRRQTGARKSSGRKPRSTSAGPAKTDAIRIRGARVHNLRSIDVDLPHHAITVITGVSGSGKSSLAFDTLFAEGQRQYIDSLSAYSRQFLDQIPRPDLDSIDGLAPTLSIDQKAGTTGSRSTVATITEIYDYLRLLFARIGVAHCVQCGSAVSQLSPDAILKRLADRPDGTRMMLLSPMVRGRKGAHRDVFEAIQKAGLVRARVDGEVHAIDEVPSLSVRKDHTIEAVVDRLVIREGIESRLHDSVELSLRLGNGSLVALTENESKSWDEELFNTSMSCAECGTSFAEVEPRTFSFNSPYGACPTCDGLGEIVVREGKRSGATRITAICPECDGARIGPVGRGVKIADVNIAELTAMPLDQSLEWFGRLHERLAGHGDETLEQKIAHPIVDEVQRRIGFLRNVGVDYLTLDRRGDTLSGGELQRVRLATSIGSGLVGVCYVLDEPSIGLHPADHGRLIDAIIQLRDQGNTIVIVEHDEATIRGADHLIDIGPGAGTAGGELIASGTPDAVSRDPKSLTGAYLRGDSRIPIPTTRRDCGQAKQLVLHKAATHNLKDVTVSIPLGCLVGISGVSGSGKSSLINDTLYPAVAQSLGLVTDPPGPYQRLEGADAIDKLIAIDQAPIGRSPRSCPATYSGVMDELRKVFATTRQAKSLGFAANRFSFNSSAGRCDLCGGLGMEKIEMNFLSDLYVTCSRCAGKRFNRQTLQVRFKGHNIADVLDLTIDQAAELFENIPKPYRQLCSLQDVGLGYLHLGQSSTTLSGGEAQRIKLGTELSRPATGQTLYVMDEPTTGLHFDDVARLVGVMQRLVDAGNTVLVIEHQFDLLAACDHIIDLGPSGGLGGGNIVATGTPENIAENTNTPSGAAMAHALESAGR